MTNPVRPDPDSLPGLDVGGLNDPIERFDLWWTQAKEHARIAEPAALTLATVDDAGRPSARVVLLRAFDARGFVFYTNLTSRKGRELLARPACALCMYHDSWHRQDSRLSAWASDQSSVLASEQFLSDRIAEVTQRFAGDDFIPRPAFWSGFRVVPRVLEFWQEGPFRRHRRDRYLLQANGWQRSLLFP